MEPKWWLNKNKYDNIKKKLFNLINEKKSVNTDLLDAICWTQVQPVILGLLQVGLPYLIMFRNLLYGPPKRIYTIHQKIVLK